VAEIERQEQARGLAVAMLELSSTVAGVAAADTVLKAAACPVFKGATVCPGKYLLLFGGDTAPIREAYERAENSLAGEVIDAFFLAHVEPQLLAALGGPGDIQARPGAAIGVIEAYTAASALVGVDAALKAAGVELLEIKLAQGMAGKAIAYLCGQVSDVNTALAAAESAVKANGGLCVTGCLPAPHEALWTSLVG
jgi:microcompartment protein CcmL/EutN